MRFEWATLDSSIALGFALFVNAAILAVSAAVFYNNGRRDVLEIPDAYQLLSPILGSSAAAILFGVALLASGLNSTGHRNARRSGCHGRISAPSPETMGAEAVTRGLAVVPVLVATSLYGDHGTGKLLVASQVVLSMQLPFAVIPRFHFVSSRKVMGTFAISKWLSVCSWLIAGVIVILNLLLLKHFG
jgi:manganese transport protein